MKKKISFGGVFIVLAAALWAFDGILRRSLYHLPPVTIVFFEHLVGSTLLTPLAIKAFAKQTFDKKTITTALLIALLGGLLGTLFITTALSKVHHISFSVVFLIQKLQPLFAMASAAILLKEKITKRYLLWAFIAIVAVFFVTFKNGVVNVSATGTIVAAFYSLGAAFFWGISTTLGKSLVDSVSETVATALRFYFATLFAFIALFVLQVPDSIFLVGVSELSRLIIIGMSTGLLAMWLYYRGLQKTEAKVATILELTFPLLAVIIDMFLYKTFLAPTQYLAAVVLMIAMYQVSLTKVNRVQ